LKATFIFIKKRNDKYIGNIGFVKWKDGGVVFYSGFIPAPVIMIPFYKACGIKNSQIFPSGGNANDWVSIVMRLNAEQFEKIAFSELSQLLDKKGVYLSKECNIPGMPE